jgi:hypothetical protein
MHAKPRNLDLYTNYEYGSASATQSAIVADPGCLSRIPDLDFYPSRIPDPEKNLFQIPDPGVKKAPDPGSATLLSARS